MMLALEYLPTCRSRKYRRSSLRMRPEGRANMEATAAALSRENGWYDYRIVTEN